MGSSAWKGNWPEIGYSIHCSRVAGRERGTDTRRWQETFVVKHMALSQTAWAGISLSSCLYITLHLSASVFSPLKGG